MFLDQYLDRSWKETEPEIELSFSVEISPQFHGVAGNWFLLMSWTDKVQDGRRPKNTGNAFTSAYLFFFKV